MHLKGKRVGSRRTRQTDVLIGQGKTVSQVRNQIELSEHIKALLDSVKGLHRAEGDGPETPEGVTR